VPSRVQRGTMGITSNVKCVPRFAQSYRNMPCQADPCQRAVGHQCLCKLRSASIADLIGAEFELCQAEQSRHVNAHLVMPIHSRRLAPRHADFCQCVVGSKCLRKLCSASAADMFVERELRRIEWSRHSAEQWASHPMPTCVPRPSPSRMHRATPCAP